jgi:cobalt transporter subunit CbtB
VKSAAPRAIAGVAARRRAAAAFRLDAVVRFRDNIGGGDKKTCDQEEATMAHADVRGRDEVLVGERGALLAPAIFAILLGAFLVLGAGFAPIAALHNAAHDSRHSFAFPCH